MVYYNFKLDLLGEFSYINNMILIRISESNEFVPFTYQWEAVGVL